MRSRNAAAPPITRTDGGEENPREILGAGTEAPAGTREGPQDVCPIVRHGERRLACGEESRSLGSDPAMERWRPNASAERVTSPLHPIQEDGQIRAGRQSVRPGASKPGGRGVAGAVARQES